jgi:hypothetical protein
MPGILQSYAMGVPAGWIAWTVGQGAERADELAAKAANSPGAQKFVRRGVLGLDRICQADGGLFVRAGLWVPDPGTGEVVATAQLELRTGPLDRDASWSKQLEQAKSFTSQRGFKVFDRAVEPMTVQAGPAIGEVTVLAERRGRLLTRLPGRDLVEARIEITVFPPGCSEVLCLRAMTPQTGLLQALSQEARAMAESLTVVVGPRGEA